MAVLQEGADHQDDGGEQHEDEGDDSNYPRPETEVGILEQVPPPLLGPAHAGVGEDEHVVLLPHGGLLHLVLPAVVDLLTTRLHKQFTDTPVGQLLAEGNGTGFRRTANKNILEQIINRIIPWKPVQLSNSVKIENTGHTPGIPVEKIFIVTIVSRNIE